MDSNENRVSYYSIDSPRSLLSGTYSSKSIIDSILRNEYETSCTVSFDSLINVLFNQQALIDSLMAQQKMYVDSISSVWLAQMDSLNIMQQEIIDLLLNSQDVTGTGEDYVRISNVQICWGTGKTNINGSVEHFPVSFTEPPIIVMNPIVDDQKIAGIEDITQSTATFYLNTFEFTSFNYQAIGYWL